MGLVNIIPAFQKVTVIPISDLKNDPKKKKKNGFRNQISLWINRSQSRAYLLNQPLREQVLHKLHDVLLGQSIVKESHFSVDDTKDGWSAVSTQMIRQASLVADINHAYSYTYTRRTEYQHEDQSGTQSEERPRFLLVNYSGFGSPMIILVIF